MLLLPLAFYNAIIKKKAVAKGIVYCKDCEYMDGGMPYVGFCNLHRIHVGKQTGYCYVVEEANEKNKSE